MIQKVKIQISFFLKNKLDQSWSQNVSAAILRKLKLMVSSKAGLLLDSAESIIKGGDSGRVISPGKPEESKIYEAVLYKNEDMAMPPKGKLSDKEISDFRKWILNGAHWPGKDMTSFIANHKDEEPYDWEKFRNEHWAFKKNI